MTGSTCVYLHRRKDTNEVFYVGIGSEKRPYKQTDRTRFWKNVAISSGYSIEITHKNLIWEEACSIESYLISFYGRRDKGEGSLVNLTDGGEGAKGVVISESHKRILSEIRKGKSPTAEARMNMSLAKIGHKHNMYGKPRPVETILKISNANRGKKRTPEQRRRMSEARAGIKFTEEGKLRHKGKSKGAKNFKSKKVINESTGKIYDCIREAAESVGLNPQTLAAMLNGRNRNKTAMRLL